MGWGVVGDLFEGIGVGDVVVGVASVAGFAFGGPIGAAVVGGLAGGITAYVQGERDIDDLLFATGGAALGGYLGGGSGIMAKGAFGKVAMKALKDGTLDVFKGGFGTAIKGTYGAIPKSVSLPGWKILPSSLREKTLIQNSRAVGVGRFVSGAVTAGFVTPSLSNSAVDAYHQNMAGFPDIPLLDISVEELSEVPKDMEHVMMPDPGQMPEGLTFSSSMAQNYRTLPAMYEGLWKSFGEKDAELTPPDEPPVGEVTGDPGTGVPNYLERRRLLSEQYVALKSTIQTVVQALQDTKDLCDAGRVDTNEPIKALTEFAGTDARYSKRIGELVSEYGQKAVQNLPQVAQGLGLPTQDIVIPVFALADPTILVQAATEDAYAMALIEAAYSSVESLTKAYAQVFQALARTIEQTVPLPAALAVARKVPGDQQQQPETDRQAQQPYSTPYVPNPYTTTPSATNPYATTPRQAGTSTNGHPSRTTGPGTLAEPGRTGTTGDRSTGTNTGPVVPKTGGITIPNTGSTTVPARYSGTPGSGFEAMALPLAIQAAMKNGAQTQTTGESGKERDGRDRQQGPQRTAAPVTPTVPANTQQTANTQQAANAPQQQVPASATGSAPRNSVTAPPSQVIPVGERVRVEGNMVYTFRDGRTQEVSVVVAQALDAAFDNAAATDARAAYADTPAKWTDNNKIGMRVDPYQVMTGDVGVWEGRTAVLVVFDTETGGTLEAVVDGRLQPVTGVADMRDDKGGFGPFVGFFHPPGIEKAATESRGSDASVAVSDQAATGVTIPA